AVVLFITAAAAIWTLLLLTEHKRQESGTAIRQVHETELEANMGYDADLNGSAATSQSSIGKTGAESNGDTSESMSQPPEPQPPAVPPPPPLPTEIVDVAIIGSELEGMYLARAAADEGLKVKVI